MTWNLYQYTDDNQNAEDFKFLNKYDIHFMWYPFTFSQSKLGNRNSSHDKMVLLNLCKSLLMATNVHTSNIRIKCLFTSPTREYLIELFSDAILKGNIIHHNLFKGICLSQDTNLTLPEAMDASKSLVGTLTEWKSSVYFNDIKKYLYKEMNRNITDWYTNPPCCQSNNLYMVLIAHNKAIVFIMQLDMNCVLLADSHQHSTYGALMCQVEIAKLENLCIWYSNMLCDSVGSKPYAYELSFLYFKCEKKQ